MSSICRDNRTTRNEKAKREEPPVQTHEVRKGKKLTLQDVLQHGRDEIEDQEDLLRRWNTPGEYLFVVGESENPVYKEMFNEILNGALSHPTVEACMEAIITTYKWEAPHIAILYVNEWKFIENKQFEKVQNFQQAVAKDETVIPAVVDDHWFLIKLLVKAGGGNAKDRPGTMRETHRKWRREREIQTELVPRSSFTLTDTI
jgi:hypothetical protein